MAVAFQALAIRSSRRVRLVFSSALDTGAFVTSWYSFSSLDAFGAKPGVAEALLVASAPNEVELHLDTDLVGGAGYEVAIADGVPALDASTAPAATYQFRPPTPRPAASAGFSADNVAALVYGVDVIWNGEDFVEGPDRDLATVTGPENVKGAVLRAVVTDGLPYDASYGANLRGMVDSPTPNSGAARTKAEQTIRKDPRVTSATVTKLDDDNDGDITLEGQIRLIGSIAVPIAT